MADVRVSTDDHFADQRHLEDLKIIYNDWPYGIDEKVIHLVVWTKFNLEDDPATDDLTPRMRRKINDFVDETFCSKVPSKNVRFPQSIL